MKKTLVIVLLLLGFLCAYATAYANNDIYEFTGTNTMYEYRNINVTKGETIYLVTDGFTTYSIDGKDFVYPAQTVVDSVSVYTRRGDPVEFDTNRYGKDMAVIELITYSYTTKEKNGITYYIPKLGSPRAKWMISISIMTESEVDIPDDAEKIDIGKPYFPDENFAKIVKAQCDTDRDGSLTREEIANVTRIVASDKTIYNFAGLGYFTNLTYFVGNMNRISSLDLSKNTKIETLKIGNNSALTVIDVSMLPNLKELQCGSCALKGLNIRHNPKLQILNCCNNAGFGPDISQCPYLLKAFIEGTKTVGSFVEYTLGDYYLKVDKNETVYAGQEYLDHFPPQVAEYLGSLFDDDGDGIVYHFQLDTITKLELQNKDLWDLYGMNILSNLTYLDCSDNSRLSNITLFGCPKLKTLICTGVMLDTIYINECDLIDDFVNNHNPEENGTTRIWKEGNNIWLAVDADVTVVTSKKQIPPLKTDPPADENPQAQDGQQQPQQEQEQPPAADPPQEQQPSDLPQEQMPQPEPVPQPQPQPDPGPEEQVTLKKIKISKVTSPSKKKVKVTWKKLSKKVRKEAKMIEIQISTDKTFQDKDATITKVVKSSKTSVSVSGLKKNTKYYVRIRVYTEEGRIKYVSPWSSTKKIKTKKK